MPDVESAGAVYLRPVALGAIGQETGVILEGQPDTPAESQRNPALNYEIATPGYFEAMRIPLKRGRLFDVRDDRRSPRVAVVSESTARRLWPGQDPIGKRLLLPSMIDAKHPHEWRTIVGVVSDVRYRGIDDVRLDFYDAALQAPLEAMTLVVRTTQTTMNVAATVQAEIRRLDPNVVIDGVTTMDAAVDRLLAPWRFSAWTLVVFAAFAFALAVVGLFSLVMLDVTHRQRELAIRLAIGAGRLDLLRSVLEPAAWRLAAGTIFGVAAALAASRALKSLLFGVAAVDAVTYATVVALVVVVVTFASYFPARKAAAVDPATLFTSR
jgi:putative ABC transport system permease protein